MSLAEGSITVGEVLQAFHRDAPNLFLGAAFITVGLIAIAFSALRRKRDPLLIYFGVFAVLYGLRLWVQANLLELAVPNSIFYSRLRVAINYLVPIPFVLYFRAAGLLLSRAAAAAAYVLAVVDGAFALATFSFGAAPFYDRANSILVIAALLTLIVEFIRRPQRHDQDFVVIRRGLLTFAGTAMWDNVTRIDFPFLKIETIGFAVFLGCLGYVAGRRTLQRDQQLSDIQKELDVAKRIQLSILPAEFPISAHFNVAVRYVPMTSVAGDFYDYVVAENGRAGLLIADVVDRARLPVRPRGRSRRCDRLRRRACAPTPRPAIHRYGVCQSCVNTACGNRAASLLMTGMTASPSRTASAPPGRKSS